MGLFDMFRSKATQAEVQKDLSAPDASYFFKGDGDSVDVFEELTTEQQLQVMQNNVIVYSCVMAKATAFQQARLSVQEKVGEKWVDRPNHMVLDSFKNNPWLSESDIEQYIQIHLNLTGKSFLWKWYNKMGDVAELWPVPPQWVTIIPNTDMEASKNRVVDGYLIDPKDGTQPLYVPVADMCYTRYPDPLNLYDGLSPIHVATRSITLDSLGETYRAEAMGSLSLPGLAVMIKDTKVSQRQKDDVRAVLKQKMGKDSRKNALILNGSDVDVKVLNPLEKFDWNAYTSMTESRICMVFRVPPIIINCLVGLENSPWANIDAAQLWFYTSTMTSEWDLASRSFTRWLLTEEQQKTLRFHFDVSSVPQMKADVAALEKRSIDLVNSTVITMNEARAMLGLPAVPNGDVFKFNSATIFAPVGTTIGVPASALQDPNNNPASLDLFDIPDEDEDPEDNDMEDVEDSPTV